MGMLSGSQIRALVEAGTLGLSPFDEELVQPASYDLRLGSKLLASPMNQGIPGAEIELSDQIQNYHFQP